MGFEESENQWPAQTQRSQEVPLRPALSCYKAFPRWDITRVDTQRPWKDKYLLLGSSTNSQTGHNWNHPEAVAHDQQPLRQQRSEHANKASKSLNDWSLNACSPCIMAGAHNRPPTYTYGLESNLQFAIWILQFASCAKEVAVMLR